MDAVISAAGKVLYTHACRGDVLRLHAQDALDDAVALLPLLLACACDQFVRCERIHLTRQIRILTQSLIELRYDLGHALDADLATLSLYHAVQFKLHPFLICHAVSLPLLVVPSTIIPCFYGKS